LLSASGEATIQEVGHAGMKGRGIPGKDLRRMSGNEQARVEMQCFLKALDSYPRSFARNSQLTFDEYRVSLMVPARSGPSNGNPQPNGRKQ
jgi:hypothetical protein